MSERKNIKRNSTRKGSETRPLHQGAGRGGKMYFPTYNLSDFEKKLVANGMY